MSGDGCQVQGIRVPGVRCRVQGRYRVPGIGCPVPGAGYQVSGAGCQVSGIGCQLAAVEKKVPAPDT